MNKKIFIRDDDVWTPDHQFREILCLLKEKVIPVVYGVIPYRLEETMVNVLCAEKKRAPSLLDIVQHGFDHKDHALKGERKYEFGPSRSYEQQYEDICAGLRIMQEKFGDLMTPGFIPPYHGLDENTLKVLKELKVPLISSGKKLDPSHQNILDVPATVALNEYAADSTPLPFDLTSMLKKATVAIGQEGVTGMLYHHRAIRTASDMRAMKLFLSAVAKWRDEGEIEIVLFSDLLKAGHAK
jgi:hypothetical protein